ncbi:hypothetical protein MBLNU230_g4979t1 [Neophaeotheca triangularis]
MALVDYSDSSESEHEKEEEGDSKAVLPPSKKRKTSSSEVPLDVEEDNNVVKDTPISSMPPLPAAFLNMYSSTVRKSGGDDPSMHQGRKRTIPHIEGAWPTHIFLDWHPTPQESESLTEIITQQIKLKESGLATTTTTTINPQDPKQKVHSFLTNHLGVSQPLHISLSRSLTLQTEQRAPFITSLKTAIQQTPVNPFVCVGTKLKWFPNDDRSRWFYVMGVEAVEPRGDELRLLLRACNAVCERFGLRGLGDKFHVSVAWSLSGIGEGEETVGSIFEEKGKGVGDDDGKARGLATKGENEGARGGKAGGDGGDDGSGGVSLKGIRIAFSEVKVRIGQDVHCLPLGQGKTITQRSLFG